MSRTVRHRFVGGAVAPVMAVLMGACTPSPQQGNDLSKMQKARVTIKGETFEVWIARTEAEREKGLMFVPPADLEDLPDGAHRGMLFLFENQRPLSFWMKNTISPLDIAFINTDQRIVKTHTMKPLDESSYPSERPARYALEVKANILQTLKIAAGDAVSIPADVLTDH